MGLIDTLLSSLPERDRDVMSQSGYGATMGLGQRPVLLVVDATYGFVVIGPSLFWSQSSAGLIHAGEEAWLALAQIERLLNLFRAQQRPVFYTRGAYRDDKWDMGSWLWKHARSRPEEAPPPVSAHHHDDIVEAIAPRESDIVIGKKKPSAFFSTPLQSYLTLVGADSLVVAGGSTSGCVRATVVDGFSANYRIAVAADACFDRLQSSHAMSLLDMHAKYADVLETDALIQQMA